MAVPALHKRDVRGAFRAIRPASAQRLPSVNNTWPRDAFSYLWPPITWDHVMDLSYMLFGEPIAYLRLACLGVIGLVVFRRWRSGRPSSDTPLAVLSPAQFVLVWLAVVATVVTGVPAFTMFRFVFWLVPM